jgi:hypothetical protein
MGSGTGNGRAAADADPAVPSTRPAASASGAHVATSRRTSRRRRAFVAVAVDSLEVRDSG